MSFIADLHIHSYLSRATSKACNIEGLQYWAQLKGVRVVGTGDFTHPAWFAELREKLTESGRGVFRLHSSLAGPVDSSVPDSCRSPVDFLLTGEISSIYKRDGRVRKVHSVLLVPDFETAAKINARLDALGNVKSDGRPILGLDPRDLLEIVLEANANAYLIPAHVWTPWFSMLGSKSGFDSPEECFGDLLAHVFAAETGLSSDPPMNWRVSSLDRFCLVSNSDLHSPPKLGRNANVFHCAPDFDAIRDALQTKDPTKAGGTIDMFPEEGKYHCDGHRKCGVCMEPAESLERDCRCPVCDKPLVLGVLHRVVELADRPAGGKPESALPCEHIIPLPEILGEIHQRGSATKKVTQAYHRLLLKLGPELRILRELDPALLDAEEPLLLGEAVRRLRREQVIREPGYDGEYGVIRVFEPGEMDRLRHQGVFIGTPAAERPARSRAWRELPVTETPPSEEGLVKDAAAEYAAISRGDGSEQTSPQAARAAAAIADIDGQLSLFPAVSALHGLDPDQSAAAIAIDSPVIIVAGPGTGKTRTLTHRIEHLVRAHGADPGSILAITFTNRAANEMRERLSVLLGPASAAVTAATFHAFCLGLLRRFHDQAGLPADFLIADRATAVTMLRSTTQLSARDAAATVESVAAARRSGQDPVARPGYSDLEAALCARHALELDAIIPRCVRLLTAHPSVRASLKYKWLCVDEYQDINPIQYELVRLLAPDGRGLCVIGDPDQAIYGFRGSDVSHFMQFTGDFPNAKVFGLGRNFRSSGRIVAAAGQVIGPGRSDMSVAAASASAEGVRIRFHEAATAAAEAEFITHEIEKLLGGTALFSVDSRRVTGSDDGGEISLADIAVLVRLRTLAAPLAESLTRLGLPVQVVGHQPFIEQAGAQQVLAALHETPGLTPDLPAPKAIAELARRTASDAGLDSTGRKALEECELLARDFGGTLADFLDHLALRQGADRYNDRAERVTLLTLHAAKGLEFPVVFIAACEDGFLPYVKPGEEPDLDEERRLLYVGMTRSQRVLYLTSARRRMLFGKSDERRPSPFLIEIESGLREHLAAAPRPARAAEKQLEFDLLS